jgi:hypothetical protein
LFWSGIPPVVPEAVLSLCNGRFLEGAVMTVPQAAVLVGGSGVEESLLESSDPRSPVRPDVIAKLTDPSLARALEVYGREQPNWGSLYKVFELARRNLGDDELVALAKISKNTLSRFHATANLPELGGLDARHAVQAGDSPEPMTISQARVIARRLLANWLAKAG